MGHPYNFLKLSCIYTYFKIKVVQIFISLFCCENYCLKTLVSASTHKEFANCHSHSDKKKLEKLIINGFSWTHQKTEVSG